MDSNREELLFALGTLHWHPNVGIPKMDFEGILDATFFFSVNLTPALCVFFFENHHGLKMNYT